MTSWRQLLYTDSGSESTFNKRCLNMAYYYRRVCHDKGSCIEWVAWRERNCSRGTFMHAKGWSRFNSDLFCQWCCQVDGRGKINNESLHVTLLRLVFSFSVFATLHGPCTFMCAKWSKEWVNVFHPKFCMWRIRLQKFRLFDKNRLHSHSNQKLHFPFPARQNWCPFHRYILKNPFQNCSREIAASTVYHMSHQK